MFCNGYSHFFTFATIKETVFSCWEGGSVDLILKCTCEQIGGKINTNFTTMLNNIVVQPCAELISLVSYTLFKIFALTFCIRNYHNIFCVNTLFVDGIQ